MFPALEVDGRGCPQAEEKLTKFQIISLLCPCGHLHPARAWGHWDIEGTPSKTRPCSGLCSWLGSQFILGQGTVPGFRLDTW